MSIIVSKIRDKHALWFKVILYLVSTYLVAMLMPSSSGKDAYNIEELAVWPYADVVAPYDFLIRKSDAELEKERTMAGQKTGYYFSIDTLALKEKRQAFYNEQFLLPEPARDIARQLLDTLYARGIVERMENDPIPREVYLQSGQEVNHRVYKDLFTLPSAYDYVKATMLRHQLPDSMTAYMERFLTVTIRYNDQLTKLSRQQLLDDVVPYKGKIQRGMTVVYRGEELTPDKKQILRSYMEESKKTEGQSMTSTVIYFSFLGRLLIAGMVLGIMMLFLVFFRKNIFSQNTHVTFIFLLIFLMVLSANRMYYYDSLFIYAVPYCIIPILVRVFFDSRTALFCFLNVLLLCAFFATDKFEFMFLQLTTGIGTIFSMAEMRRRSQLFVSAFITLAFYVFAYCAYHFYFGNKNFFENSAVYVPIIISAICILFTFPLIYLFEKVFGFVSDFTLLELSDFNNPLLRELSQKVPGTFQHSLQVANLAEEAVYVVGGNPLLVRAGAMYHDIGKMENPRYFTENQVGEVSPHADLSPEESAHIVIAHVIKGIEKAKSHKLPEQIIDFIRTHHGTTATRFFLHNYRKEHPGELVNLELFRYPGPIPFSKETAILMMADSVEAASRSLKKYDAIAIDELVDRILQNQIEDNQFINSDITFRDINNIKKIFKKRLMNIYHVRIEYPR